MIRKHVLLRALTLFSLFFAASCARQPGLTEPEGYGLTLRVTLPVEEATKAREAGTDALNENKISTLDLFIYKTGEETCAHQERIEPDAGMTRYGIEKRQNAFTQGAVYTIYVVANGGTATDSPKTLTELKQAVVSQALNPDAVQTALLMDGKTSMILNDGTNANKNIDISLKRGVAKIRVELTYGTDYQPAGQVTKKLVNYASDARVLEEGDAHSPTLTTTPAYTGADAVSGDANRIILYSYANDWNSSAADETFIYLNVPIRKGTATENHYYKVPLNYRLSADGSDPAHLYRLRRNYIYNITAHINGDGGSSAPEAALLENVNYEVVDWSTNEVDVWIRNIMYLYVDEQQIVMNNTDTYRTGFQSSSDHVEIKNLKVFVEGTEVSLPTVNVRAEPLVHKGTITIESPVPDNFVPRVIAFDVENRDGIVQSVEAIQYPPIWIGHITSQDVSGTKNRNMYTVNVKQADLRTIPMPDVATRGSWGDAHIRGYYQDLTGKLYTGPHPYTPVNDGRREQEYGSCLIGYPALDANGYTDPSTGNRWMISPNFMFASRVSSSEDKVDYWAAVSRCKNYSETDTDGITYRGWRMPTYAEMLLLDILQNVSKSEIKDITDRHRYWTADPGSNSAFRILNPSGGANGENAGRAEVRCVRDIDRPL